MRVSPALLLSLVTFGAGGATLSLGLKWQPNLPAAEVTLASSPQPAKAKRADPAEDGGLIQILLERPPFTPGRRRPPPPVLAVAEAPAEEAAAVDATVPTVRGIALSGRDSIAIVVLDSEANRLHRIALGSEIVGWRVTEIERESVTFSSPSVQAKSFLRRPGEPPHVEMTQHDSKLAEKEDADTGLN
jgi:hypothetical protein